MSNPSITLSLLLLISFSAKLSSSRVFLSIDCGTSDAYTDQHSINWVGDANYTHTGETHTTDAQIPLWAGTLRAFPKLRKSCYTIPVPVPVGVKILVRAWFYYGNYDGKSSPPTFALSFDANMWGEVLTVPMSTDLVYREVIYAVDGDAASVCVAQVEEGQVPFINAIEVRGLDSGMYGNMDSSRALFNVYRSAFDAPGPVRFPDDIYDRIWLPNNITGGLAFQSDTSMMHVNITDNPPASVLQNASSTSNALQGIVFSFDTFMTYINLYFVEMTKLRSGEKRFIQVFTFDEVTEPFSPPYQSVREICITNSSGPLSIRPTNDSTLPPIISAMEVFTISDPLSNGTNAKDVEALKLLQHQFDALQAWAGDPCLPIYYNWEWVKCSSDQTMPRITSMDLSSMDLSGVLPDFSAMDALKSIDLHNNSFSGSIPDFFGNFPNLKELNLADNYFSGPIPSSLTNNNNITLHFSGNQKLCQSYNCAVSAEKKKKSSGNKIGLIFAILVSILFIISIVVVVLLYRRQKRTAETLQSIYEGNMHGQHHTNARVQEMPMRATDGQTSSFSFSLYK
ncbi:putative leucine-rich repeat receptor-like protein kinase [Acorus calamus]|uniref:Leucine-rich repeat receptor-like protein kinase n=1 Tax=Acorus calamus TaxID=4465 RepID=A0AAV9CA77_ACOCL|nr:putative leucine-rich repeat receptor-like protein kinase [Acorus calamus]